MRNKIGCRIKVTIKVIDLRECEDDDDDDVVVLNQRFDCCPPPAHLPADDEINSISSHIQINCVEPARKPETCIRHAE